MEAGGLVAQHVGLTSDNLSLSDVRSNRGSAP
jgi:hypothetical protein